MTLDEFLCHNGATIRKYDCMDSTMAVGQGGYAVEDLVKNAYLAGYEEASRVRIVGSALAVKEFTPNG